jgi:hypothetical protein
MTLVAGGELQFGLAVHTLFGLTVDVIVLNLAIDAPVDRDLHGTLEEDLVDLFSGLVAF